jgi:hypothetical protein
MLGGGYRLGDCRTKSASRHNTLRFPKTKTTLYCAYGIKKIIYIQHVVPIHQSHQHVVVKVDKSRLWDLTGTKRDNKLTIERSFDSIIPPV